MLNEMDFRNEVDGLIQRCGWPKHEIIAVLREIAHRFEWNEEAVVRASDGSLTVSRPLHEIVEAPAPVIDEPRPGIPSS